MRRDDRADVVHGVELEDDEGMLLARRPTLDGRVLQVLADLQWTGRGNAVVRGEWEPVTSGLAGLRFWMHDPAEIGANHGVVTGDWTRSGLRGPTESGTIGGVWAPGEARAAVVAYWTHCS